MSTTVPQPGSPGWWQERRAAPTEDKTHRPGRPSMPVGRVIDAALELVDEIGPDDFSMRLLAQRLGSSTATLYRNFSGKDEILVLVVDQVLGELSGRLPDTAGESTWQGRLTTAAETLFSTLEAHPRMVPLLGDHVPLGPHALAAREAMITTLLSSGLAPETAAKAYTAIAHYVVGFAGQLPRHSSTGPDGTQDIHDFYRSLDPARYPATVAAAPYLPSALREEFRFGLRLLIDGLTARMTEPVELPPAR